MIDSAGLTLLEEPETNLHSAIVAQFPEFIAKILRVRKDMRQVILTTHSFDILSNEGIAGEEVLVLTNTKEGTDVSNVNDIIQIRSMLNAGFTIADAVIPYSMPKGIDQMIRKVR